MKTGARNLLLLIMTACALAPAGAEPPAAADPPSPSASRMVDVGGHEMRARVVGDGGAEGPPTIVLEAGFGEQIDTWRGLPDVLGEHARVVLYERAGVGRSAPGPAPRTARRVAAELHALLEALEIEPPYLLVGHSLGGLYIRVFADLHPGEVAGLVFLDPTTEGMHRSLWSEDGWSQFAAQLDQLPAGLRAEGLQLRAQLEELEALAKTPDRPAAVVIALPEIAIAAEAREQMAAMGLDEERLRELQQMKRRLCLELAARFPRGRVVEAPGASHFVHHDAPHLVARTILEVLSEAR